MGTVTPTVVPGEGYVRVEVNWADFTHNRRAWIYRTVGGVDTKLRDGDYTWLSNGIAVAYDHEAPLDTPLTYKSAIPLNYNGDFEAGVLEWLDTTNSGTIGTVTQSYDYWVAGTGAASLKLVPDGVNTAAKAVSEFMPATVGTSYTLNARMMLSAAWSGGIRVQIQWYNGTSLVSTSQGVDDFTPFPGEWGTYTVTATAPATTTQMRVAVVATGTPPTSLALYADEVYATTAAATVTSATVVVPSDSSGWWTDPLHPATKVRLLIDLKQLLACGAPAGVAYLGVGPDRNRPADGAVMEVEGAPYPVATWGVRKAPKSTMRVATPTLADLAAVNALHASGAPLLLSMNAAYGEAQQYQLFGDLSEGRVNGDQREAWRIVYGDFSETLAPVGPPEGTLRTRYVDITKYATFAAATSAGATWLDVLRGNTTA
jgi:hypothetical protein